MSYEYDDDKNLILSKLNAEEWADIVNAVQKLIDEEQLKWKQAFGPAKLVSVNDMTRDEAHALLDEVSETNIWSDINYQDGYTIEPVEGYSTTINGWALVPGRRGEADDYYISPKPSDFKHGFGAVFSYYNLDCDFCDGEGSIGDQECDVCAGEGTWEVDASGSYL